MTDEKTIVTTPSTGTVTQQLLRIETVILKKQSDVSEHLNGIFMLSTPSKFIEHIDFLKQHFLENYDRNSNDWSERFIFENDFITNELKLHIVKFYELFCDIENLNQKKELLTNSVNNERVN